MKTFKHLLLVITFVFLVLFQIGCSKSPSLTLNSTNVELKTGETFALEVKTENVDGKSEVVYTVKDGTIVSVKDGVITALRGGETTITVSLKDFPEVEKEVTVKVISNPSLTLTGPNKVYIDEEITLTATVTDIIGIVEWSVDDDTIAEVNEGKVTGLRKGTVVVTATIGTFSESLEITVARKPLVELEGDTEVYVGETLKLNAKLRFAEGDIIFTSSDTEIATVSEDGIVTPIKGGKVTIKASFETSFAELEIVVFDEPSIEILGLDTIYEFKKAQLTAKFAKVLSEGEEENTDPVVWESSDERIATVDENGKVLGIRPGKVRITARRGEERGFKDMTIKAYDKRLVYEYDGGVSEELYQKLGGHAEVTLNNYNCSGGYWGMYPKCVFIATKASDPGATFSDRIYIGKNEYSGYYEVKGIITSGASQWQKGAEYVIVVSSSHENFNAIHRELAKVKVGDICIIDKDPSEIKENNTAKCEFFNPEVDIDRVVILPDEYNGKICTPTKLGYKFLGWFDKSNNNITSLSKIDSNVELHAKWQILNPVQEIEVNEIPTLMYTKDKFKIEAKILPNNAFFTDVLMFTSDKDILFLYDDGTIEAKNEGKATITLRDYASQVVKTFEITVKSTPQITIKFANDFNGVLDVNETLTLEPTFIGDATSNKFTYEVKDKSILSVDEAGVVKALAEGSTEIVIKLNSDKEYTLTIGLTVNGLSNETKVDQVLKLLADGNYATVQTGNMSLYNDGNTRYYKALYGSVNQYLFDTLEVNRMYEEAATNNPNCHKDRRDVDSVEFVTVHDTATLTSTAQSTANNMTQHETSIHYVVGEGKVFSCVPEKFIAYHAGDGTKYSFSWTDSKVKANGNLKPEFDLKKQGDKYLLVLNGTVTDIECPTTNGSRFIKNPTKDSFASLKPVYTIINGNYHIGPMWTCFSQNSNGVICSFGGNNNSIGIETSVNTVDDYYETMQRTAMLVTDILLRYNLGLERVQQHNSWSGKNCPQSVRSGQLWDEFMKFTTIRYTLEKDYKDVKISMKSNNPELVNNAGKVIAHPTTTTTVSYDVTVTSGSTTKTIRLYSVLPGSTIWHKMNGIYPASVIWNNGHFAL